MPQISQTVSVRISARFLLLFLFLLPFFFFFQKKTFAQTPPPQVQTLNTNPDVPNNLHNNTQVVMIETISSMVCQLTGYDFVNPNQKCLGIDFKTNKIGFVDNEGGIIKTVGKFIGYTFIPPTSGSHYVGYLANNFGVAKTSYAASDCTKRDSVIYSGIGFCGLQPVLSIWVFMRNIAYLLFVLIFIIIGLAIMLRIHIDPRTVMTIQNQIPKIIIGIVLVTFSFAIAGFLIDMMYVSTYLVGNVISKSITNPELVSNIVTSNNPFDGANEAYTGGVFKLSTDASTDITDLVNSVFFGPSGESWMVNRFGEVDLIGGVLKGFFSALIGILAFLIISIAIIYVLIRLWLVLLLSYLNIIMDVIFAPFWFIAGLLPGSTLGISAWFKDIIANLSVFPATVAMLVLTKVFLSIFESLPVGSQFFVPPLLGNPGNVAAISGIIGLGFLFMLPNILSMMKSALKAPKLDLGPIFRPIGAGAGAIKEGVGSVASYYAKSPKPGDSGGTTAVLRRFIRF